MLRKNSALGCVSLKLNDGGKQGKTTRMLVNLQRFELNRLCRKRLIAHYKNIKRFDPQATFINDLWRKLG